MSFDVFRLAPGKYHNSPPQFIPAGTVEAGSMEEAAINAMYRFGSSQIAVMPIIDPHGRPHPPE